MRMIDQDVFVSISGFFCGRHSPTRTPARALILHLIRNPADACHLVVGVELVRAFRARIEDRGSLVSATCLRLAELHLGIVALGTFFIGDLLCARNFLRDRKRGEAVALALQCGRVVGWSRNCARLVWPFI